MTEDQYVYQNRAVVFLDILGFQDKLVDFEKEAVAHKEESETEYLWSRGVSDFIETFKSVISFLDEKNFEYYLFSDNICITADYNENNNILIDILIVMNDLFFRFAEKGYFLRGGLDIGKFVVDDTIAIGVPLVNAYKLERDVALFPRIVLSENYKKLLDDFENANLINEESINKKQFLIKKHCEVFYLNVFFNLIGNENIFTLLESIKSSILKNLTNCQNNEKVAIKYEWLVNEYDLFIEQYISELMFLETSFIHDDDEIAKINSLKFKL